MPSKHPNSEYKLREGVCRLRFQAGARFRGGIQVAVRSATAIISDAEDDLAVITNGKTETHQAGTSDHGDLLESRRLLRTGDPGRVSGARTAGYSTIQTTVYRLKRKKALRLTKRIGKANIFEAAIARDDARRTDRRVGSTVRRRGQTRDGPSD